MDRHRPSIDARWQRIGHAVAPKLRLGRERLADDLATVEAVRDAAGDEVALVVDFNQGLALGEALERCHAIDDLGLAWIEEPLVYDDLDGSAQLAAELKTPMQMGENFYGPRDLYKALQMNSCDYVMPDFMRTGGVTGWQRATPIAAAAGIPVSTHLYPEVAAHVLRVEMRAGRPTCGEEHARRERSCRRAGRQGREVSER